MNTKGKSVLIVEDEESIGYALKVNLESEGYTVVWVEHAVSAFQMLEDCYFDILLLDVMLPDTSGFEICNQFRKKDKITPIIFLSALSDSESRLKGLRYGADDFISKPFNLDELLLKIERLIYKSDQHSHKDIVYFGNCWIDFVALEAKGAKGEKLKMSKLEFDLAELLIRHEGIALKREYIYKKIWDYDEENLPHSRTLDNFIVFLRKYFEIDPASPQHFVAVRGVGYKFNS